MRAQTSPLLPMQEDLKKYVLSVGKCILNFRSQILGSPDFNKIKLEPGGEMRNLIHKWEERKCRTPICQWRKYIFAWSGRHKATEQE